MREGAQEQPIEKVGRELRKMMTFFKKKEGSRGSPVPGSGRLPAGEPLRTDHMKIFTFDTTLRDGTQGESVSFSVDDKLVIARKLDDLGIDYIEGGWPGSNPKDRGFLRARVGAEPAARQADGVRLDPLRQESRGRGPQRARPARRRDAGGVDFRQELGPARRSARSGSPKRRTSSSSPIR